MPDMVEEVIARALRIAAQKGLNQSEFAELVGVSPQDVTNWKRRGMPPAKHEPVARALGLKIDQLLGNTVEEPGAIYNAPHVPGLAHSLSHSVFDDPIPMTWEGIVQSPLLPDRFTFELSDDANAPEYPKGMTLVWSSKRQPQFGSLVLIEGGRIGRHVRFYRQGRLPGAWIAKASNPAFADFSTSDDVMLRVIAVAEWRPMP
jgi:transcriptional regulator with XRE-family HTH domain